jgi:hypothetical protein
MCDVSYSEGHKYYYRWKNANILVVGCSVHVKEVFDVLNNYQSNKQKKGGM